MYQDRRAYAWDNRSDTATLRNHRDRFVDEVPGATTATTAATTGATAVTTARTTGVTAVTTAKETATDPTRR